MTSLFDSPPEAKRFRVDLKEDEVETDILQGEAVQEGHSPAAPSSARSGAASTVSTDSPNKDDSGSDEPVSGVNVDLLEMISKTMFGSMFPKLDNSLDTSLSSAASCSSGSSNVSSGHNSHSQSDSNSVVPQVPPIPGALAVAQSPTAHLFAENDWSWHRNPAAAIRSGGTNKQTPVWKYFVYSKAENLSRCIIGDCTYTLKGPHTSTLACHLKKHTAEYAEFQKLKSEYSRERVGTRLTPSPCDTPTQLITSKIASTLVNSQQKKKENAAMNNGAGTTNGIGKDNGLPPRPHSLSPLMQSLMTNPLLLLGQHLQSTANSLNPLHNTALQQHGLTMNPNGQIVPSKKWRRDEKRNREIEIRLSLALASCHIPFEVLSTPHWKDLLDVVQPKFTLADNVAVFEEICNTHHTKLQQVVRQHVSASRCLCLQADLITLPACTLSNEPISRLLLTASFPFVAGTMQNIVLGLRPVNTLTNEGIFNLIEQVSEEYNVKMDNVVRIVCSGLKGSIEDLDTEKQIHSFSERLESCIGRWLEQSKAIDVAKTALFTAIFDLLSSPHKLQLVTHANRFPIDFPLTGSLPAILKAILPLRNAMILAQCLISDEQWRQLQALHNVLDAFEQVIAKRNEDTATIDSVIPTIRALLNKIDRESANLGDELSEEIRAIIAEDLGDICDEEHEKFNMLYIKATALNPHLAMVLGTDQLKLARKEIEKDLGVQKKENRLPLAVEELLANVINGKIDENQKDEKCNGMLEANISQYFDELKEPISIDGQIPPHFPSALAYWQSRMHRCSLLSSYAIDLLSVPSQVIFRVFT
ncbi:hypothetical protein WR25_05869 isoform A [Diploscapter pachys]|uniref:HAT C-terminal dimerisation domain-containing protein n=1 Tax=Diploscapter pachys TaxID=2018661 RepID=A0A2A2L8Y1_9BILA|nr:hypothetical protein WR25_05869 isoform A [Diploscapter pachys]